MNGVDGVRAVNKYIPFACGGGVYTYIFVYHIFTIFSDPFNESFYEITIPQVFEFWVSNRLFFKVRIHVPRDYRCINCRLNTTGVKSLKNNVHIVLYHLSPNQDITTIIFYINKLGHLFWSNKQASYSALHGIKFLSDQDNNEIKSCWNSLNTWKMLLTVDRCIIGRCSQWYCWSYMEVNHPVYLFLSMLIKSLLKKK